jgi:PEP-CTERM motif
MKSLRWLTTFFSLAGLSLLCPNASAQTPGVLYSWNPAGVQDWNRAFGAASTSATLANTGGTLEITETSATAGGSQAFSDGFNTIRDASATFGLGCCGGIDLTGLTSLQFDLGHNGTAPINVQFYTQASPASTFLALGPDVAVAPGTATYTLPLTGLTSDQIAYLRTVAINVRDHAAQGNLIWTIGEVRSVGTPLTTRTIADHNGGAADFDGVICNFDCAAIGGGNGGQNTSGMTVGGGALQWTDLGGSAGAAVTWGNGTQNAGGGFSARPVDLSNYDYVTIRMSAAGADASVGIQFYMQTGSGFTYQSLNDTLPVDGQYHDIVFPLAGITNRSFVDTNGINLFSHANDLFINVDSVIYSSAVPEPATMTLFGVAVLGCLSYVRRTRAMG